MNEAFVVRLGPGTNPSSGLFVGWVEVVHSGEELRFHSANELLHILGRCFFQSPDDALTGGTITENQP
jgi:hypothetical protein